MRELVAEAITKRLRECKELEKASAYKLLSAANLILTRDKENIYQLSFRCNDDGISAEGRKLTIGNTQLSGTILVEDFDYSDPDLLDKIVEFAIELNQAIQVSDHGTF